MREKSGSETSLTRWRTRCFHGLCSCLVSRAAVFGPTASRQSVAMLLRRLDDCSRWRRRTL